MPALSDPKLEAFAQAILRNLARGLSRTKAAEAAAREIGHRGSSVASNARRRANYPQVKARLIELAAPKQAEDEARLACDLDAAKSRLAAIICADIDLTKVKAPDVVAAVRQLAAIEGWHAPTSINVNKHVSTDWSTDELVAFLADAEARLAGTQAPDRSAVEPDQVH